MFPGALWDRDLALVNRTIVRKTKMYFKVAGRAGFEIHGECTARNLQYSHFVSHLRFMSLGWT